MTTPSVTFAVDDVIPAPFPQRECDLAGSLAARLKEPVLAASHGPQVRFVPPEDTHPLMAAVHMAFSEHRPLVLSPDIIWVTIAQGLALHVVQNAEALRFDLVRHQGKKRLVVPRMAWDFSSAEFWNEVVDDFSALIKEESTAMHDLMVCDFSTTGTVERVVSQVVLMDALREYFDYVIMCICGIPTVTLEGTPADWSRLREKAAQLSRYGLDWWIQHLLPICDQFVRASQGNADRAFWKNIYKPKEIYGGDVINGWICKLFPFLRNGNTGQYDVRSPVFESDDSADDEGDSRFAPPPGWIQSKDLPTGLSRVPLLLQMGTSEGTKQRNLALTAGFVGVSQSARTMALRPELGWVVHEDLGLDAMLRRVCEEHQATPPLPAEGLSAWKDEWADSGLAAEILRLYSSCDGASLFGGQGTPAYRLRASGELEFRERNRWLRLRSRERQSSPGGWTRFCDLADGGFLAFNFRLANRPQLPIFWVRDAQARHAERVADTLEQFLQRALDSKGRPYFQEPGFTLGERVGL
ncbi:DUF4419 domain-containing protein [Archangium violaceum]|uniref:DUF4419 domain-containing protein n=1 Tax=Archangium violaceum TaxID=83451 RepID=UPI002B3162B1|nr:DUF4419 domain-containing protein [Archangium gephyra]